MVEGSSEDDPDWFERALGAETEDDDEPESTPETEHETGEREVSRAERDEEGLADDTSAGSPPAGGGAKPEGPTEDPDGAVDRGGDRRMGSNPTVEADEGDDRTSIDATGESGESFGFDVEEPQEGFETEEYQTDVPRVDVGIEGLDEMIQGGVPERALLVAIGGAGTGKTTFGLQFLQEALANGDRGVFITLEESHDRILKTARDKGWPFDEYEEAGNLAIVDLDPVAMANSLTSIRNELPRLVEDFGAARLVLDSVSLLEMMYDDQATRRTEIYDFARSLKAAGVTTLLTSEADDENPFVSRFGVIEYLTDGVFVLRYVRPEDFRETRLAIEVQKIRDANHSRETKPYEITNTGISVYRQANIF